VGGKPIAEVKKWRNGSNEEEGKPKICHQIWHIDILGFNTWEPDVFF
jgi:hypothetical protein